MPIINYEGEVVGVAEIMNKRDGEAIVEFTKKDEQIFSNYLDFCGIGNSTAEIDLFWSKGCSRNVTRMGLGDKMCPTPSPLEFFHNPSLEVYFWNSP